jgi:hypothetical protein
MYKTAAKDIRNGYVLHFEQRIHRFVYHLHVTPQGIANVNNHYKKDRPFFDNSFRPMAINEMTNKMNEPPTYTSQKHSKNSSPGSGTYESPILTKKSTLGTPTPRVLFDT